MQRTFAIDVLQCPNCGGRLKLLAAVLNPPAIRGILASLGLPTEAPEMHAAHAGNAPRRVKDLES